MHSFLLFTAYLKLKFNSQSKYYFHIYKLLLNIIGIYKGFFLFHELP